MLIYSLSSSENLSNIRYVGYTKKKLKTRLNEHKCESKNIRTHKDKWIQSVFKRGFEVIISEIERVNTIEEAKSQEISYIIDYKNKGFKLVNGTNGGDGVVGLIQSEKLKNWNRETKSKKIHCFLYQTKEFVREFSSITNMISEMKFTRSRVGKVLQGKNFHHKGYTFSMDGLFPNKIRQKRIPWNKGLKTKSEL